MPSPRSPIPPASRTASRRPLTLPLTLTAAVLAIGAAGYYLLSDQPGTASTTSTTARGAHHDSAAKSGAQPTVRNATAATHERTPGANANREEILSRSLSCLRSPSVDDRQREFLAIIDGMTKEDAPAVRDALLRLADQGIIHAFEWGAFWRKWAKLDQVEALAFLSSSAEQKWAPEAYQSVFRGWAEASPDAALRWLNENESTPQFGNALVGFIDGLAATDPKQATAVALEKVQPGSSLARRAVDHLIDGVFQAGLANGLVTWFDELPREGEAVGFRHLAADGVHQRLLASDLRLAADWTAAQSSTGWREDRHITSVAREWSKKDPALAMEWAVTMAPSPKGGHVSGIGTIVTQWAATNPSQLEAWLDKVRGTKTFDQAARDYAIALARKASPDQANDWANQIQTEAVRTDTLKVVAQGGRIIGRVPAFDPKPQDAPPPQ